MEMWGELKFFPHINICNVNQIKHSNLPYKLWQNVCCNADGSDAN